MIRRYVVAVMVSIALGAAWVQVPGLRASQAASAPRARILGQSATPLPDGHWLLVGGQGQDGPLWTVSLFDPSTNVAVTLPARLNEPRAWHTATILADGSILITGGRGAAGELIGLAERFELSTETFAPVAMPGAAPRANHTSTLLTDGHVLVSGGKTASGGPDAEVWNVDDRSLTRVEGGSPRESHTAALLSDGRVLMTGGTPPGGGAPVSAEVYDPRTATLAPLIPPLPTEVNVPAIADMSPANGATDVPLDVSIRLRLSRPALPHTVNDRTIVLSDHDGPVSVRVVPAEDGRLVFVWPLNTLRPESAYELTLTGMADHRGKGLEAGSVRFSTRRAPPVPDSEDVESWVPDPSGPDRWRTHRPSSPWQTLPALRAEPGVTAVAGQVLTLDGRPLPEVTLRISEEQVRTDRTGRFLLRLARQVIGHQELAIDGSTASRANKRYGFFEYGMNLDAGDTTVLPFTIWMPRLDLAHEVEIPLPSAKEEIVTTPYIPGLELHIAPGTTIRTEEGKAITRVGITPIPVDRPPFPLAKNVDVPIYFTIQPGGAYLRTSGSGPNGGSLVYPNYHHGIAGERVQFFHYDPDDKGWYVYGLGTVASTAAQVVPDATTRLYAFTGAMINAGLAPPATAPPPGDCTQDGDPVDLATGVFIAENTDLTLSDVLPLSLKRTYRSGDPAVRPFGVGTNHSYGIFLWSARQYQEADLILPDGGRVHYVRTSPGTSWADAVFEHTTTPTAFYKSVIRWNGNGWDLTLKNGTVYVFGENAPLQSIRDRYGNRITITRANGQTGNITRITSPNGRAVTFTYDSGNRIVEAKDTAGRVVAYTYDSGGRLWRATDANGGVTTYAYDASDRMTAITNPRNITLVTNEYGTGGRVVRQTHADGGVFQFSYTLDTAGRISGTEVTDPVGTRRRTTFNTGGYCIADTRATGESEEQTTRWTRDATSNLVLASTDALGRQTAFAYDGSGNRVSLTRLAGTSDAVTTRSTYEGMFNQLTSVTDPAGHTIALTYDSSGDATRYEDGLHHASTFTYRSDGQPSSATDPLGNATTYGYSDGDLTATVDPLGRTSTMFTDAVGRVAARTDPRGARIRFGYDAMDRITRMVDPIGGQTVIAYDANGNIISVTDPRSNVVSYSYTATDRLEVRTDSLNGRDGYEYDLVGNLIRRVDRKGQTTEFSYDHLNRRTAVSFRRPDGALESNVSYEYDAGNRLVRATDSNTGTIEFRYDDLDRLISEVSPQGTVTYSFDTDGRRTEMAVTGQPAVTYDYDDAERLTAITQGGTSVTFSYDDANRRTRTLLPNGMETTYSYDASNQLAGLRHSFGPTVVGDLEYLYDPAGNRVNVSGSWARTALPGGAAADYDAADRLTRWNAQPFAYDANGNLLVDGRNSYTWNARNQLIAIDGGVGATFQYDALGRRTQRALGGSATSFLYDNANVTQELSGGEPTANIVNGIGLDQRFARTDGTGRSFYLTDGLPSVVALTNDAGAVTTAYTYEPFGVATVTDSQSTNTFRFSGREDDGTDLIYARARYYSPATGRFVSEDPLFPSDHLLNVLGLRDDLNAYSYARNNPGRWTDLDGTFPGISIRFPWPMPNGNAVPGVSRIPQDQLCSVPFGVGSLMDANRCVRSCCENHDRCYSQNGCNQTSWLIWPPVGPCNLCNIRAMHCVAMAAPLPRHVNPCNCPT